VIYKRGCNSKGPNGTCSKCGQRGACGVYWYKFMWQGKLVRESTKQGNDKVARQMEAAHRTSLAKGEVGIRERRPSPTLAEFMSHTFHPWVESTFREKPRTAIWYRGGIRRLSEFALLAKARLSEITAETVHSYIVKRQTEISRASTVNCKFSDGSCVWPSSGVRWSQRLRSSYCPGKRDVNASQALMRNRGTLQLHTSRSPRLLPCWSIAACAPMKPIGCAGNP
jgi:hypothetical protein